ncbi:hypothetical protein CONPUDRAFT_104598 [Coniophora puteana RWD-64-598 SS2]|uniref:Sensitive to high expression protein 9, mitochondrial n=1 Tax=Coniophora puteana (strain RWD-64-598) TaxID=741705 RepID=A0A5M3MQF2_CONPW|nr:uncharacterized protein CONPUDRAFT_104598 [Coniophora puteana RWD-64-598 SS2]EIW81300.1 hypothetical protein CONPUDRAFT_104598 [Coniophora puteana RWD-64-598 SS2]
MLRSRLWQSTQLRAVPSPARSPPALRLGRLYNSASHTASGSAPSTSDERNPLESSRAQGEDAQPSSDVPLSNPSASSDGEASGNSTIQLGAPEQGDVASAKDSEASPQAPAAPTQTPAEQTRPETPSEERPLLPLSKSLDVEQLRGRFNELTAAAAAAARERTNNLSAVALQRFSRLGAELNKVTGYEQIEALKQTVAEQEAKIKAARRAARESKTAYDDAVVQRAVSQREVNDLLQRKSGWSDADVSRFTELVRADHALEQAEARAKAAVATSEDAVDKEFSALMRAILARYHEEQVWSDKIRSASTYGSLAVLGVNMFVFVLAIVLVEPWKRRRLAQTFEGKVEEMGVENRRVVEEGARRLEKRLEAHELLLAEVVGHVAVRQAVEAPSAPPVLLEGETLVASEEPSPDSWFAWMPKTDRERQILLSTGSALAGGVVALGLRALFS